MAKTIKNATHPVAIAVQPLKESAMINAEKFTREQVKRGTKILADAGWDLDAVAPRPNSLKDGTLVYREKAARRQFFCGFARSVKGYRMPGEVDIVMVDDSMVERLVRIAKDEAAASFIAYVNKLVSKIGEVKSAKLWSLSDSNLWSESRLEVVLVNGTKETWDTQQIWNRSVLGKIFPQWPTRQSGGTKRERVVKAPIFHYRSETPEARRNYTLGFACAGSATGAHRMLATANSTADRTKVTCSRCLKALAQRDARQAAKAGA